MNKRASIREKGIVRVQDQLKSLVQELHDSAPQTIVPRYPLVLIFALPKASMQGSIILPDQQNKPIHEGIVLKTWKPFWKGTARAAEEIHMDPKAQSHTGVSCYVNVWMEPSVKVGDHVLFPHAAGIPVPHLNSNEHSGVSTHGDFRLIRDDMADTGGMLQGGILGVLEYSHDDVKKSVRKWINKLFIGERDTEKKALTEVLLREFVILDRALRPLTSSGK